MEKILIIDDNRAIRNALSEVLQSENYATIKCESPREAVEIIGQDNELSLVICDIMMEEMNGTEVLQRSKELRPELPFVMISGESSIGIAVQCLHSGADDFIEKPLDLNYILRAVKRAHLKGEVMRENKDLRRRLHKSKGVEIIGKSPSIQRILNFIDKVAPSDSRVLITGDNGTGKELVARLLHLKSPRADQPFVEVNCAAFPAELIESELFGHEKGSFTSAHKQRKGKFEQAQRGTIFLDEIGDMSLSAQSKVLRALQENKISRVGSDTDISVDVRVIAATNKDIQKEILAGRFREDLYHRISVINLHLPPLRERRGDIPLLVDHFLTVLCMEQGLVKSQIEDDAMEELMSKNWTGNVRELRNCTERLLILSNDPSRITLTDVKMHC